MLIQRVKACLQTWFGFPQEKVFCQVATVNNKNPHVRTMDLYNITEDGNLIFLTDTSTRKWSDLQGCSNIAVCIVHLDHGQMIIEGSVALKTSIDDINTTRFYWENFLDPYWKNFYLSRDASPNNILEEIPTSFGVIIITPQSWEILEINQEDFLKSSRKQFQLIEGAWVMHELLPV